MTGITCRGGRWWEWSVTLNQQGYSYSSQRLTGRSLSPSSLTGRYTQEHHHSTVWVQRWIKMPYCCFQIKWGSVFHSFLKVTKPKSLPALWAQTAVRTAEPPGWRCRPVYPAGSASRSARPLPRCSPETWLSYGGTSPNSSPDRWEVRKVKRSKYGRLSLLELCPDVQWDAAENGVRS